MIPSCFTLTFSLDCLLFNNKQTNTKDKQLENYFIIIFIYFIPENPLDQTSHENRLCPMIKKKQTNTHQAWMGTLWYRQKISNFKKKDNRLHEKYNRLDIKIIYLHYNKQTCTVKITAGPLIVWTVAWVNNNLFRLHSRIFHFSLILFGLPVGPLLLGCQAFLVDLAYPGHKDTQWI